jgi:hypothetical protein
VAKAHTSSPWYSSVKWDVAYEQIEVLRQVSMREGRRDREREGENDGGRVMGERAREGESERERESAREREA